MAGTLRSRGELRCSGGTQAFGGDPKILGGVQALGRTPRFWGDVGVLRGRTRGDAGLEGGAGHDPGVWGEPGDPNIQALE